MAIVTLDCETQGLSAQRFLMGAICFEDLKVETFRDKTKLYARLLQLAEGEKKRGKKLTVYAHNLQYDYIAIGAHEDEHNLIYCTSPFIADYTIFTPEKKQEHLIKWIDTIGLFRGSLEEMGKTIGVPKGETPEWLKLDTYEPDFVELALAEQYMAQDTRVLMQFILKLKAKLNQEGVRPPMLITTSQIAMSYFLKQLKQLEWSAPEHLHDAGWHSEQHRPITAGRWMQDIEGGALYATNYPEEIYQAYRGGRVQAFQTGECASVNSDDLNSLYPHIASTMRFPDLRSEQRIYAPLAKGWTKKTLFATIGISSCIVRTPKKRILGYLPVRTMAPVSEEYDAETSVYPETIGGKRVTLVGTWTHLELAKALSLGYDILEVFWSITWLAGENPFAQLMPKLYDLRKQSADPFDNSFYKLMMNGMLGKFAQHREKKEVAKIDVEELPLYRAQGWEATGQYGADLIVEKSIGVDYKKSHAPIISCLVTAGARDVLYDALSSIPRECLWYCDTDGIIYDAQHTATYKYSNQLGGWKQVKRQVPLLVYGKKQYMVDKEVRLSRVPKRFLNPEAFAAGIIVYDDILGVRQTPDKKLVGTRVQRTRTLRCEAPQQSSQAIYVDHKLPLSAEQLQRLKEMTHWPTRNSRPSRPRSSSS